MKKTLPDRFTEWERSTIHAFLAAGEEPATPGGTSRTHNAEQSRMAMDKLIEYGPHKGRTAKFVFLWSPDYVSRIVIAPPLPNADLRALADEFRRLMPVFDAKPILTKQCSGDGCERRATCVSVYRDNVYSLRWWCDDCNPYQTGADRKKLQTIRTYMEAILHVRNFCNNRRVDCRDLVDELAKAKGLPEKYGAIEAETFLWAWS